MMMRDAIAAPQTVKVNNVWLNACYNPLKKAKPCRQFFSHNKRPVHHRRFCIFYHWYALRFILRIAVCSIVGNYHYNLLPLQLQSFCKREAIHFCTCYLFGQKMIKA